MIFNNDPKYLFHALATGLLAAFSFSQAKSIKAGKRQTGQGTMAVTLRRFAAGIFIFYFSLPVFSSADIILAFSIVIMYCNT